MSVAETILQQLGGRRFSVMTGARKYTGSADSLTFRIPSNFAKAGINAVKITLDPTDTYTMIFSRIRGLTVKEISAHGGIYFDKMQEIFSDVTGLETSLGSGIGR